MEKQKFDRAVEEWKVHAEKTAHFSDTRKLLNCDAYKTILSMGKDALPLVRKLYDRDDSNDFPLSIIKSHGLVSIVCELVAQFHIPEEIRGQMEKIEEYTKKWLDENMHKYLGDKDGTR